MARLLGFQTPVRVAVIGATGYTGGEILRLLSQHSEVAVKKVVGHQSAGLPLSEVHPGLRGLAIGGLNLPDLVVASFDRGFLPWVHDEDETEGSGFGEIDVFFLALPHGEAARLMSGLVKKLQSLSPSRQGNSAPKVIDLSGDFRLDDPDIHKRYYGFQHSGVEIQSKFVYGLPELFREQLSHSQWITNPGCFATACALALAPLIKSQMITGKVVMDAVTGSSGSGNKLGSSTHHPERNESFVAYKPFRHQHLPEIEQTLKKIEPHWFIPTGGVNRLVLQTHSGPFSRGIYGTIHAELVGSDLGPKVEALFQNFYGDCAFVRICSMPPELRWVRYSNFVDLFVQVEGRDVLIHVAIDNLGKGAAGQAIQNMNLALGLPESAGLTHPSPVV